MAAQLYQVSKTSEMYTLHGWTIHYINSTPRKLLPKGKRDRSREERRARKYKEKQIYSLQTHC